MPQQRNVSHRPTRPRGSRATVEELEARQLLCAQAAAGVTDTDATGAGASARAASLVPAPTAAASFPLSATGLPLLHSLPGARAAVFLDFDGYGSYGPYDTDGSPDTFGATEQSEIADAWRQVSSYFSMLDLDVTTEQPETSFPYSYSLISNGVTAGQNLGNFPSLSPINFNTAAQATGRPTALAHEIGHSLGLGHQGVFDALGNKTDEYAPGYDALHGPIMGLDYAQDVHKWFIGHPSTSPLLLQDDLAVMAATHKPYTGGDGFRPDDVPGALDAASPLGDDGSGAGRAAGMIERLNDADAYAFTSSGGGVAVDLVPPAPSMLDGKLEVYAADGTLIAAADGAGNDQHLLFRDLPAGAYYAVVSSHGDYADVGPYELAVRGVETGPDSDPEHDALPAPAGLALTAGAGTAIEVRWDAVAGADGYAINRSDDGLAWQQIATTTGGDATRYTDATAPGGHRYFYSVIATDAAGGTSAMSEVRTIVNAPAAVSGLSFLNWKSQAFVLNWRDGAGESGYRIERSTNSSATEFVVVGEVGPNVISFADKSFALQATYRYRVTATSPSGESTVAEVSGGTPLTTIEGVRVVTRQPTRVGLRWVPVWGAVGYAVERSEDGVNFTPIGTTTTESYNDDTALPVKLYSYRVKGTNNVGETGTSATVVLATPSDVPLAAPWQVADVGGAGVSRTLASGSVATADGGSSLRVIGGGAGTNSFPGIRSDSLRFVYQTLSGNGSVTARVAAPDPALPNAVAGVMIRQNTGLDAPFVFAAVSAQPSRIVAARQPKGSSVFSNSVTARPGEPAVWLRISRKDGTFTVSTNQAGRWLVGNTYTVPMASGAVVAGVVVSSGSDATLTAASFDNVSVSASGLFIATPASASPPSVTGISTALYVLGGDDGGEMNLTYTWSALGVPPGAPVPTFNRNGTNLAKNATATFVRAGQYVLGVTIKNAQGQSTQSRVTVDVVSQATLSLSPPGVPVPTGGTLQLGAAWVDQFRAPINAAAPRVTWQVDYGTIDLAGVYTPPPDWSGTARVTGTAGASSATLNIYVYDNALGPTLLSAASRKVHRRRGVFDIPLVLNGNGGLSTIEPRIGPTTLVFNLSKPVSAADGTLDAGEFSLTGAVFAGAVLSGSVIVLDVTGVKNGTLVSVGLRGLVDVDGNALRGQTSVGVRIRQGDVSGDGRVGLSDLLAIRRQLLLPVRATNFVYDVNLDGVVNAADLVEVRRRWAATLIA
jgi:fibronectin type 3 domain-containing protein